LLLKIYPDKSWRKNRCSWALKKIIGDKDNSPPRRAAGRPEDGLVVLTAPNLLTQLAIADEAIQLLG
jgi:hypothetical protein